MTRAVTIDAPPAQVWAWVIQHGQDRAGFYSYTWLENLVGSDIHNADELHPEWQQGAAGDQIPLVRQDYLAGRMATSQPVFAVAAGEALLLGGADSDSVAWVLRPLADGTTRLLVRERNGSATAPAVQRGIVLLLATDAYVAFGLLLAAGVTAAVVSIGVDRRRRLDATRSSRSGAHAAAPAGPASPPQR